MSQLAIKGHPTKGREVIQLLELLGGVNIFNLNGTLGNYCYYIDNNSNKIYHGLSFNINNVIVYTLEEFEKKFPYKVGDIVVNHKYGKGDITRMLWIDNEIVYEIEFEDYMAYCKANELCKYDAFKGLLLQELTEYLSHATREELDKTMEEIEIALAPFKVGDKVIVKGYEKMGEDEIICVFKTYDGDIKYKTKNHLDTHYFMGDSLIKVEKSNKEEGVNLQELERKLDEALAKETTESLNKWLDEEPEPKAPILSNRYDYAEGKCGYVIPDGYEFDCIKEGFKTEIILKPIKPQYPTTYLECCRIVNASPCVMLVYDISNGQKYSYDVDNLQIHNSLRKLKICRDAYWKIAGEELGLDKPWEPDWMDSDFKYCLKKMGYNIGKLNEKVISCILAFPTPEMRDAFYENFKDLIEQCKELL